MQSGEVKADSFADNWGVRLPGEGVADTAASAVGAENRTGEAGTGLAVHSSSRPAAS